jgi:hypothetical protein
MKFGIMEVSELKRKLFEVIEVIFIAIDISTFLAEGDNFDNNVKEIYKIKSINFSLQLS